MSRLNYRHLYYFWKVASLGNLTLVAKQLHISQSALSAQIKQLEDSINLVLFDRSGRKLVLTEAGKHILGYANDIFMKGEELESFIQHGTMHKQVVRIGADSHMSRNFIETFIAPLLPNPDIQFVLISMRIDTLLDQLASHNLDLVLSNMKVVENSDKLWQAHILARQQISIMGPNHHYSRPLKFPEDYASFRWLLPGLRSEIRSAFEFFCSQNQFEPDIQAEVDDMAMLRLLARDSGALSVLPEVVVKDEVNRGELVEYMKLPGVYENFYAITVKRQYQPLVLTELLKRYDDAH
jgi:LysR family transcriptional activator of nhaA